MEMEHYLEYIDNEVWKVIQNGNSKKRVTKGKDGVYRVLPPTTQEEQFADEKERKARTLLLMAVPKDHLRRFHGMDDAKEIWAAIKTRFGGNANSKKMQKAVLKQQFEAFTISSKESLEKGYDRFQKLLSQLDALGAGVVAFLSQAKASSSKHKPHHNSGSYSSYTTSSSKATPTATPGLADEVIHSFLATNADDVDLIHEDLDQIDDLDLEEMDINWQIAMTAIKIKKFYKKTGRRPRVDGKMHVAFDKRKVECFNCHNTGHFARECKFKGTKDGSRQEASRGQDFKPVRTEKEALMTIDEGQINWVEQTTDEEINHALMAFTVNRHFARECKFKGSKEGSRQEAGRGQDFKPVRTEKEALMTIDEGQINWVEQTTDEELNHALMAFTVNNEVSMCSKLCLDSYNALKAKYDELQSEFGDQEAALTAHKIGLKKVEAQLKASHKQQISLNEKLHFQANQIFEKDEKLKKYRRIGMKAVKDKDALQKIVDSWFASSKNLWKLIDCGMSSTVKLGLGYSIKSNAEVLSYEEEMDRGIFASIRETDPGYHDIPLYSRFKQVEYKGVPHPLSGDYTPREQEDIDDSLYEYGKHGPQPQSPSPTETNASSIVFSICPSNDSDGELGTVSNANSTVYSSCQSNDSDGEQGTVSDHSVHDDPTNIPSSEQVTIVTQKTQPQVPKPQQTVDPSCAQHVKTPRQPIKTPVTPSPIPSYNRQNWNQRMERELGAGSSFERKPCFVCGSLSHLIKDCDYYEKKMAREAALKSKRVIHANVRQVTPAWTNSNRVNKANQFTPRPVQLNNIRPNFSTASRTIKTGRVNVNSGHGNVNSGSVHVNAGTSSFNTGKQHVNSGSMYVNSGTTNKSGSSRVNTGKQNANSGRVHVNTARITRPVLSNPTSQVNFKSPKTCFSKQRSPENRPFTKNTAYKSNNYAVKGTMGTAVKTSAGCVWRKTTPLSNTNSGPTPDSNVHDHPLKHMEHRGIFDSGCSGHMTGNRAHLEDYQELSKVGSVTFGEEERSKSKRLLGKGISNPLMAVMVCPKPYGIQLTNVSSTETVTNSCCKDWKLLFFNVAAGYLVSAGTCFCCYSILLLCEDLSRKPCKLLSSDMMIVQGQKRLRTPCVLLLLEPQLFLNKCYKEESSPQEAIFLLNTKSLMTLWDYRKELDAPCFEAHRDQYLHHYLPLLILLILMEAWVEAIKKNIAVQASTSMVLVDLPTAIAKNEAISLFLAFASFMGFNILSHMSRCFSLWHYDEEVYVSQPPGFVDPEPSNKKCTRWSNPVWNAPSP
ncbi:ribonuclease H-like domain-containing protein [Tanacetum coccineum]